MKTIVKTVTLENDRLFIIDQRSLPLEEKILELRDENEVIDSVRSLAVRGAPAIGIVSAYGVYIAMKTKPLNDYKIFEKAAFSVIEKLASSRPTAYNLFYALGRIQKVFEKNTAAPEALQEIKMTAIRIHEEDLERSAKIAEYGQAVVGSNARVLTHCNAGALATGGLGTALSVLFKAHASGKNISVLADETRPLLQGSRLTAWELKQAGIPYHVITDSMAGYFMQQGKVDLVIVGADRIAKNGDFANKIGTYPLAVLANHHGIPFYTAAPVSTFDFNCAGKEDIPIEERDPREVLEFAGVRTAPENSNAFNPAFDITPGHLLTGIITEFGILRPPFKDSIAAIQNKG